jgi:chromosome segregation ATPase
MQMNTYSPILIAVGFLTLLSGCSSIMPGSTRSESTPAQSEKFSQPRDQAPTAVENAIILSDKYAKLAEEMSTEKAKNRLLLDQNTKLQEHSESLKLQLEQTQKELNEANALLVDMRKELNNWKADVLGYRDEMRAAHKAQIEALLKIINILGGEAATVADANIPLSKTDTNEPNK